MSAVPAAPTSHFRWFIPILITVVLLMGGGGLLARALYRQAPGLPAPVLATPGATKRPLDEQPGSHTVELTPDAAAHPQQKDVRVLLQSYFDAINEKNYDGWKNSVTRDLGATKTHAEWLHDFRTTEDGSILVYRIDEQPDQSLRVFLGFTSTQDPSAAPQALQVSCLRWNLVLPLTSEGGHWKVSGPNTPEYAEC
ncbi:MAG TPA: hypothetical protein VFG87_16855 [Amycolatopsis sp.]|nr:hypothetical protein [Amycolatopsis sp.]